MVRLPSNLTTALLALCLGLLVGAGGYHLLDAEPSAELLTTFEQEDLAVLERDRRLEPADTSGQADPQLEIRYRAIRDTVERRDTLLVPAGLGEGVVSDRTPIEVSPERVTWTYYDPSDDRREQRVFSVPGPGLEGELYGLLEARGRPWAASNRVGRVGLGAGASLSYKRVHARLEATIDRRLSPVATAGLRVDL